MADNIYFEEELRYLREEGARFARMYPQQTRHLSLDSIRSGNTRMGRMFEAFAFLTAGIKRRLDDSVPEFTESLFEMLWPQILEPVPGTCIVEFASRSSGALQHKQAVKKGTALFTEADPETKICCQFLTAHDVTVNKLTLDNVECITDASGIDTLTLTLKLGADVHQDPLRLYIHDELQSALRLRKALLCDVESVTLKDDHGRTAQLIPQDTFVEGGFGEYEDLFPEHRNVNRPLDLIRDYFLFPERYLFVDVFGLGALPPRDGASQTMFSIEIRFNRKLIGGAALTKSNIRLYCVPAVNIFRRDAEPLYVDGKKIEYDLISDAKFPQYYNIHSVESVTGIDTATGKRHEYARFKKPNATRFYSLRRERQPNGNMRMKLSMNGQQAQNERLIKETLHINSWQSNGTLMRKLTAVGGLCKATPDFPDFIKFENITIPNNPINPPTGNEYLWAIISHLACSYSDYNDVEKLKELLYTYDWVRSNGRSGAAKSEKCPEIEAIKSVTTRPIDLAIRNAIIRGMEMNVVVDEHIAPEETLFLLGTVLARSLSCMASINTFLRFVFTMSVSGKKFEWCCQAGERIG